MTPDDGDDLVRQLMSGDPAAAAAILARAATSTEPLVLTAAALLDQGDPLLVDRAARRGRPPATARSSHWPPRTSPATTTG